MNDAIATVSARLTASCSPQPVGWVEPVAKPIAAENVMGLALLDPSYGLRARCAGAEREG